MTEPGKEQLEDDNLDLNKNQDLDQKEVDPNEHKVKTTNNKYSNTVFRGEKQVGWFTGTAKFSQPNGVVQDGQFDKGEFHGDGTLIQPNGGRFIAKWERGKMYEGYYKFFDDLRQEEKDWDQCQKEDRRFYTEVNNKIKGAGESQFVNDTDGPAKHPPGTQDVGEGQYDPNDKRVHISDFLNTQQNSGHDTKIVDSTEQKWITSKCRMVQENLN